MPSACPQFHRRGAKTAEMLFLPFFAEPRTSAGFKQGRKAKKAQPLGGASFFWKIRPGKINLCSLCGFAVKPKSAYC